METSNIIRAVFSSYSMQISPSICINWTHKRPWKYFLDLDLQPVLRLCKRKLLSKSSKYQKYSKWFSHFCTRFLHLSFSRWSSRCFFASYLSWDLLTRIIIFQAVYIQYICQEIYQRITKGLGFCIDLNGVFTLRQRLKPIILGSLVMCRTLHTIRLYLCPKT